MKNATISIDPKNLEEAKAKILRQRGVWAPVYKPRHETTLVTQGVKIKCIKPESWDN